jgi:hypothetical protein
MVYPLLLITFALLLIECSGFITPRSSTFTTRTHNISSKLNSIPENITGEDARGFFYIWFFGGSGGAGVALRQFPQQYEKFQQVLSMKDESPTLGGETVGISPRVYIHVIYARLTSIR